MTRKFVNLLFTNNFVFQLINQVVRNDCSVRLMTLTCVVKLHELLFSIVNKLNVVNKLRNDYLHDCCVTHVAHITSILHIDTCLCN